MTEQELRKMGRSDLVELLLILSRENVQLREELEAAKIKLAERSVRMEKVGSMAEASLALNGVFEAAQAAAEQYLEQIRQMEQESRQRCERMQELARQLADAYLRKITEPTAQPKQSDQ